LHDGSIDTVFRFHQAIVFNQTNPGGFPLSNPGGFPSGATGDTQRRQVEQFVLAFDSNLAPIVGQQVTLTTTSLADSQARATLLIARANAGECDVVVKGIAGGRERGWVLTGGVFQSDELAVTNTDVELRAQAAAGAPRTYMCVPPGDGVRVGIDRDEDGFYDGDELIAGSDPTDPGSTPETAGAVKAVASRLQVKNSSPDDELKRKIVVQSKDVGIVPAAPGSGGDPRCNADPVGTVKARLHVVSISSGQSHETPLPCQNWVQLGSPTSPKGYKYKDPEQDDGTAQKVVWKAKNLKATLTGKGPTTLDYDLQVGVHEAPVAARFQSGDVIVCLQCTADNGKDGSDGKQFLGKTLTCPAPTGCLASPDGAFLD
jgi:hypothetical protein